MVIPKNVRRRWKVARRLNRIRFEIRRVKEELPLIGVERHRLDTICRMIENEVDDLERGLK